MNIEKIKQLETYYIKNDFIIYKDKNGAEILLDSGTPINFHKKQTIGTKQYIIFNVFNSFIRFKVEASKINDFVMDFSEDISKNNAK